MAASALFFDALEEGMANFAFGRLGSVFDLGERRQLDRDASVRNLLGVGLGFPDQRLWPRLKILCRRVVETVSTFPA
jgi:hypothetical protein